MTQLRDLAEGKRDLLMFDPRKIKVDPGYNIRDLSTPEAQEKLRDLARSIGSIGVQQPLTVRLKGDDAYVVAGHRRLAAALIAIEGGAEIKTVPCIAEAKGTSEDDRTADLIVSNSQDPLKALEVAAGIKRLIGFGWDSAKIAERCGWGSVQTVDNYLALLSAPEDVKSMVRSGEVSASTAREVVRKHGDKAGETLANAKRQANSEGKTRVTTAHVKASTGEFQATAGNIKVMIGALELIAKDGDGDAAEIARDALEKIGVLKKTNGASAGHGAVAG
jgi:ParB family chromosome partitioning protein